MVDMPMAKAMKALRAKYGLSQPAFVALVAEHGGSLREGTLTNVETGRRNMSVESIEDLVVALGLADEERELLLAARRQQSEREDRTLAARLARIEERLDALEAAEEERGLLDVADRGYGSVTASAGSGDAVVEFDSRMPHAADDDEAEELADRVEAPTEYSD